MLTLAADAIAVAGKDNEVYTLLEGLSADTLELNIYIMRWSNI